MVYLNRVGPEHYYKNLRIPDDFKNLEYFMLWYLDMGLPLLPSKDSKIYHIEEATAVSIFKYKNYQVEFYIVHPGSNVAEHSHPGVDIINFILHEPYYSGLGAGMLGSTLGTSAAWGNKSILMSGQTHGNVVATPSGYTMLTFEYWHTKPPTSVAVRWKGATTGPLQDDLIEQHYPGSVVSPGYADTSNY